MAKIEIDTLDTSLDNSADGEEMLGLVEDRSFGSGGDDKNHLQAQGFLDSGEDDGSYNFRDTSGSTVTYRLVQVAPDEGGGASSGPTTAVYHSHPPNNVHRDNTPVQTVITNPLNGQFYVIGNDVFGSAPGKTILPRETHGLKTNTVKKRDDRRRATHNEVERRRRDKINSWIIKLAKIIPHSQEGDKAGAGGWEGQSKGGILAKACEYITEMKEYQNSLSESIRENDHLHKTIAKLNHELSVMTRSNNVLRNQLTQHGIVPHSDSVEGS